MRRLARGAAGGLVLGALLVPLAATTAQAHPLGNFTVNHYDGLELFADRVENLAVVDSAEIPTLQATAAIDIDGDGILSAAERAVEARTGCAAVARDVLLQVDGVPAAWTVNSASFVLRPGAAGLDTSRLECRLRAAADLSRPASVVLADRHEATRIGWHEITAVADGVRLENSPVPAVSVSRELLQYPNDLLSSPLDVRTATFSVKPGAGSSTFAEPLGLPVAGPVARVLNDLDRRFDALVGAKELTPWIGTLAILLSLVLGASHAAMPGHGKTVMAAYIAGRRGSVKDALTVGATVTLTHTLGVLVVGALISAAAVLAGEKVLAGLGTISGLLVAGIGLGLLRSAVRNQRRARLRARVLEQIDLSDAAAVVSAETLAAVTVATTAPASEASGHGHSHGHAHGHAAALVAEPEDLAVEHHGHGHSHTLFGGHRPAPAARATGEEGPLGRMGLVGMGIAGGLVPSPSALIVLLGAVALGRTVFGVVLVLGYGLGMAATLTAAGLLLVRLRDRIDASMVGRVGTWSNRLAGLTPVLTATLVLVVGAALAVRGLVPLLA